jgi:hypothetical protein
LVAVDTGMTITHRNLDGYGAPPIEWDRVKAVLDGELTQAPGSGGPQRHTVWLATINPDGSPHALGTCEPFGATKFQLD